MTVGRRRRVEGGWERRRRRIAARRHAGHPLADAGRSGHGDLQCAGRATHPGLASFETPGAYEFELWVSDGEREGSSRMAVTVAPTP